MGAFKCLVLQYSTQWEAIKKLIMNLDIFIDLRVCKGMGIIIKAFFQKVNMLEQAWWPSLAT